MSAPTLSHNHSTGAAPLATELRQAGQAEFARRGLPTTHDEEWRFTPLGDLARWELRPPAASTPVDQSLLGPMLFDSCHPRLVLVDGRFVPELSSFSKLPDEVVALPLEQALARDASGLDAYLGATADPTQTPFTALSAATFTDGLFLHVPADVRATFPIEVLHLATDGADRAMVAPRHVLLLDAGASATVVESYHSLTSQPHFTNTVTEIHLGAGARLDHTRVGRENETAFHVGFTQVDQAEDSHYRSFALTMGARLARHNLHVRHRGQRVETLLYGLYLTRGEQLADSHTAIFHDQPNCNSWEVYKGVLGDRSRAVFNGKVLVDAEAQKTDAKQTNRNLLLTDQARVDTKPQLEIFADDVRCTHGATIGRLNEQQRYYLQTRGIGGREAERLLIWAFAAEVVAEVADATVRTGLERIVRERLSELTA